MTPLEAGACAARPTHGCAAAAGGGGRSPPILDKKCGNVPPLSAMGRKHYMHRARIRTAMRWWAREGYDLWWVTLTSSPTSESVLLRKHFQAWRKRIEHALGISESSIQYVMVDTREGHGVLHLVLAIPSGAKMGRHQLDYSLIGEWWQEIHGARQVKFLPIVQGDTSIRKLSQYIVSQYMANGQGDALVRISGSRFMAPLARWRNQLLKLTTSRVQAYQHMHTLGSLPESEFATFWRLIRGVQWRTFRECWDHLIDHGWCSVSGKKLCIDAGHLVEV